MAKDAKTPSKTGFILSIVILVLGMTVGFILLSIAYQGANWIKFLVFIVYLLIVSFLIKFSIGFVRTISEAEKSSKKS